MCWIRILKRGNSNFSNLTAKAKKKKTLRLYYSVWIVAYFFTLIEDENRCRNTLIFFDTGLPDFLFNLRITCYQNGSGFNINNYVHLYYFKSSFIVHRGLIVKKAKLFTCRAIEKTGDKLVSIFFIV